MSGHICGLCKKKFKKEEDYLKHTCGKTKQKPTSHKHQERSEMLMKGGD